MTAASSTLIPINDLRRYSLDVMARLLPEAERVLASGHFVLGARVREFEAEFAAYCGVAHCVGVANGTDALELGLRALGIGSGDHVLLAANAAMYGTSALIAIGAVPVFVDVDASTSLLTDTLLQAAIDGAARRPRAVIVTHLYGRLAPMRPILSLCKRLGIAVLEDCAQAHGARNAEGVRAGAFGDIASFSFYPTKNLGAIGDGGAVVCSDEDLAAKARQLRQYGWSRKYTNELPGGRNSRLDELQAAFLSALLPDLDARNSRRREIANRYSREIRHPEVQVPAPAGNDYVAHLFVVQCIQRDRLVAHLHAANIGSDIHYPIPDHRQPVHGDRFTAISLPTTERLCERVLTLPCFAEMTDAEVDRVIAACNTWSSSGECAT